MKVWELVLGTGVKGKSMVEHVVIDNKQVAFSGAKEVLWANGGLGELRGTDDDDHNDYLGELFDEYNAYAEKEDDKINYYAYKENLLKDVCSSEIELVEEHGYKFVIDTFDGNEDEEEFDDIDDDLEE